MLHCVHQLVSYCAYLLFAAEQVVYSEFLKHFWKQLPDAAEQLLWAGRLKGSIYAQYTQNMVVICKAVL